MRIVIVIPTYNEEGHIGHTIQQLEKVINSLKLHQVSLLIYDSNSSDKTTTIVETLQQQFSNIFLLKEEKKTGLGNAYIKAMRYVMEHWDADLLFEFDADGSHQPCYIPLMIETIEKGADVVVGSRYVHGGGVEVNWAWHRRMISRVGNWVARLFLTRKFYDLTSGFRATKVSLLKEIPLENLLSKNYAYKIHLFWELFQRTRAMVEVPIIFVDRQHGVSKFPRNNIWESLKVVVLLRIRAVLLPFRN